MGSATCSGVAGYTSGEAYKIGFAYPYTRLQRAFIRQTIDLGGEAQKVDAGINQFAGSQTANRLVITVGKFSVADIFDNNKYAHDPRNDFLNWAIIDTGTFDYAAEPWGYTLGAAAEWYQGNWTLRGGLFDLSILPNNLELDPHFQQFQWVGEIERRYDLWGHPGKIAVTGFLSRGRMGTNQDAIALAQITGGPADIAAVRQYRSRGGLSMNFEQEITSDLGAFVRAGMTNGDIEPYELTDIDRTVAAGLALKGTMGPSRRHVRIGRRGQRNFGRARGLLQCRWSGILIGDGQLPHPGLERIIETYYQFPGLVLARHARLPVHRQSRLQPRPRAGFRPRRAAARTVLRRVTHGSLSSSRTRAIRLLCCPFRVPSSNSAVDLMPTIQMGPDC